MAVDRDGLEPDLREMLDALAEADAVYRPSRYWERLNAEHLRALAGDGYRHFKRTLNDSYFQFGFYAFPSALPLLFARWLRRPDLRVLAARHAAAAGVRFERLLAVSVALYAHALAQGPHGELLSTVPEPALGDPIVVRYGSRAVTQDLCHSLEEFRSVRVALDGRIPLGRIGEIGAGYGRLAYLTLRADPDVRYTIADIPPALYVAQRYLTGVLPEEPVFRFRRFAAYAEVAGEMERARLVFLEPQQLALLPEGHFDLVQTISTLHEMRPDQIANFITLVDRTCRGAFYLKQWLRWRNPVDGVEIGVHDYRMPSRWQRVFERRPLVPRSFFEALYVRRA